MSCTAFCACNILRRTNNVVNYNQTFVRFRKPRWVPKAPSKIFKVREPTPLDPVENEKMTEWLNRYNTARKSILMYLQTHSELIKARKKEIIEKTTFSNEQLFYMMEVRNRVWNAKTAVIRENDVRRRNAELAIRDKAFADRDERELSAIQEMAKQKVVQAKDWKDNYVTEKNMDDALEELLNSRVHYDFALNPDGTKTTDPVQTEAEQKKSS
ncbi:small ribosomal subunit protein mS26-like [Ruditapes philippinarum]|uniref:small ribosomal subunit protein mS26-like n=1 Tax=Ruditapes philippinarum TaxID=129788 RepID=UPI00295B831E|nr:small ribosomal subunit protein mS26-like [Ruditapes philippinarum]